MGKMRLFRGSLEPSGYYICIVGNMRLLSFLLNHNKLFNIYFGILLIKEMLNDKIKITKINALQFLFKLPMESGGRQKLTQVATLDGA